MCDYISFISTAYALSQDTVDGACCPVITAWYVWWGHSYSTDQQIIQCGQRQHVTVYGNWCQTGVWSHDVTSCSPGAKSEPMTHLYTPNIPDDKTELKSWSTNRGQTYHSKIPMEDRHIYCWKGHKECCKWLLYYFTLICNINEKKKQKIKTNIKSEPLVLWAVLQHSADALLATLIRVQARHLFQPVLSSPLLSIKFIN